MESLREKLARLRKERNRRREDNVKRRRRVKQVDGRIRKLNVAIRRLIDRLAPVPPNHGGWHPRAVRTQVTAALSWVAAKPKLVWHTTQGYGLPTYSGSMPHFTLDPKSGKLWQHVPITGGAYALRNTSGGVETNRARAIQVELVGFAEESHKWGDGEYARIAELARWIEKHAGVPRSCDVTFRQSSTGKIRDWVNYTGHCGHQHVPENDHWDPGLLQIGKVI
jgi:hypothetical protein